jgi:hypothetical protein
MVAGFTTTYAISTYHHLSCEVESRSWRGALDTPYYGIKFGSDLQQLGSFLRVPSINKTDRHDITEILLKAALNTITLLPHLISIKELIWTFLYHVYRFILIIYDCLVFFFRYLK